MIDLRDIYNERKENAEEYKKWKNALKDLGYDNFLEFANNEPLMIPDDEFEDYAWQLAEDIGAIGREKDYTWPINHIDWKAASDELKMDFSEVEVDGTTYYFRSW